MQWNNGIDGAVMRIAQSNDRHLRVMAGPGTGKTFSLKRRVTRLLEEGVDPHRILAVTFTRTAAADLVKELASLNIPGCEEINAGTLHSFCFRLLSKRVVFAHIGRVPCPLITKSKYGVLRFEGEPMIEDLDNKAIFGSKRDRTKRIRAFDAAWARLQSETPGWPTEQADRQFQDELTSWLRFHQAMLIGELVPVALRYLRDNPTCEERTFFQYIVVDEYQDLNKAEQVILDLLSSSGSLFVVGDLDQSIYRFRHAHPDGITDFSTTYPDTHDEPLDVCRRCPSRVVEMADYLIRHNHPQCNIPRLRPQQGNSSGEIHIVQWDSLEEEANGIARYVEHLIQSKGYQRGDILILAPRRYIGYGIREELARMNITTHSFFHEEVLEEDHAQCAFSLLTLLANKEDRVALRFWLGFGDQSWLTSEYGLLRRHCEQSGLTPWTALEQIKSGVLQLEGVDNLGIRYRALLSELAVLHPLVGLSLVDALFPANQDWAKPLRETAIQKVADSTEAIELLGDLRAVVSQPEMPESGDFVRIMSLHKSKGLTSRAVIIAGCVQGLIPSFNEEDDTPSKEQASLQEQRRLFYVYITRPTDLLVLSSVMQLNRKLGYKMGAKLRMGGGQTGPTISSNFINELGPSAPAPQAGDDWVRRKFCN